MIKNFLIAIALAFITSFAAPAFAQETAPSTCYSTEQFKDAVKQNDPELASKLIVLNGTALETFAAAMDTITGGGHGPMSDLVFLDPESNDNEVTVLAVFRDHCYIGTTNVLTSYIKQALGQGV